MPITKNRVPFLAAITLAFLLYSAHASKAANLKEDTYYTDQIYLALTPESAAHILLSNVARAIPTQVDQDAFLNTFSTLLQEVNVLAIEVPFFQAKGSPLERVLQVVVGPGTDLTALCDALNAHPGVAYAERIPRVKFTDTFYPNDLSMDSNYSGQWFLHKIQAPKAWTIARGSPDIKVAVVDQAIDIGHTDLKGVIWTNPGEIPDNGIDDDGNGYVDDVHGYDVAEDDPDPSPDNAQQVHGTHVAGLVSAETDNGTGIASIGFNVSIIPVKCAYSHNLGAEQFKGVTYASMAGADIISCSWGTPAFSITHKNVIDHARQQGAIVVCSSGNDGRDTLGYPAAYTGVISVGATTILDRMSDFSNYNEKLSVSSPGSNIISTWVDNQYESMSGTSMSTPIVSGLLGLMKSHYPQISNDELNTCLLTTTDPIDIPVDRYEGKTGTGRINAYKAVQCVDALKKEATGITMSRQLALKMYPNPTDHTVFIELPGQLQEGKSVSLEVSDLLGRVRRLKKQYLDALRHPISIQTHGWASGVYLIEIRQGDKRWQGKLTVK